MTTMRKVAAQAGVSAKTVSRVFTGDPHVHPETRERVQRVMKELNYVPNVTAKAFRYGTPSAIGVAVPDVVDPYFAAIVRGVDKIARSHGLSTFVTSVGEDPREEQSILEQLLSRKPAGLVAAPVGFDHSWLKRWAAHTPLVFVDREPTNLEADSFTDDDEGGAHAATAHLVEKGHRSIAYVGDQLRLSTEQNRLAGYRRALHDADIEEVPEIVLGRIHDREAAEKAKETLERADEPPTAIFSSNARTSMNLVAAYKRKPLPMVGFGDFPLADLLQPSLTVIDQNPDEIGRLAAERILAILEHPKAPRQRKNVQVIDLIERESSTL